VACSYCILSFIFFCAYGQAQPAPSITLSGTIWDFANADSGLPQAHPDFNSFGCGVYKGMVASTLQDDGTPKYLGTGCVTSEDTFNQWFHDTPGVNIKFPVTVIANYDPPSGTYVFANYAYFPIDNEGYGNENKGHNFGFCTHINSEFTYQPGQVFAFTGDDDVWVFINGILVIDLGGVHPAASASLAVDSLGLKAGNTYSFDLFFCERHVVGSDLAFSTSIQLIDPCGTVDTDGDGVNDKCDACPNGDLVLSASVTVSGTVATFTVSYFGVHTNDFQINMDYGDETTDDIDALSILQFTKDYSTPGQYTPTLSISGAGKGCGNSLDTLPPVVINPPKVVKKCKATPITLPVNIV